MSHAAPVPTPTPFSGPYEEADPLRAPGIGPDGTYTLLGQVIAFIAGLLTMLVFFPALFPAAVLYTKAEETFVKDPDRSRRLVLWSWFWVTVVPLAVLIVAALVMIAMMLFF